MPSVIDYNVNTAGAGNRYLLYALWDFFTNGSGGGGSVTDHFTIIDESPDFATGAANVDDDDYFVVEVVTVGPGGVDKFQVLFTGNEGASPTWGLGTGTWAEICPVGGWAGVAGVPGAGFGGAATFGFVTIGNYTGVNSELWMWANETCFILLADKSQDGSVDEGCLLGYFESTQVGADDPSPLVILSGVPGVRTGQWADSARNVMMASDGVTLTNALLLDYTGRLDNTTQPNQFSGKYDDLEVLLFSTTAAQEAFRGKVKHIKAVALLSDKDTLASQTRVVFNYMSLPWDGSVPV